MDLKTVALLTVIATGTAFFLNWRVQGGFDDPNFATVDPTERVTNPFLASRP